MPAEKHIQTEEETSCLDSSTVCTKTNNFHHSHTWSSDVKFSQIYVIIVFILLYWAPCLERWVHASQAKQSEPIRKHHILRGDPRTFNSKFGFIRLCKMLFDIDIDDPEKKRRHPSTEARSIRLTTKWTRLQHFPLLDEDIVQCSLHLSSHFQLYLFR